MTLAGIIAIMNGEDNTTYYKSSLTKEKVFSFAKNISKELKMYTTLVFRGGDRMSLLNKNTLVKTTLLQILQ